MRCVSGVVFRFDHPAMTEPSDEMLSPYPNDEFDGNGTGVSPPGAVH
jgi:hypothetical protein